MLHFVATFAITETIVRTRTVTVPFEAEDFVDAAEQVEDMEVDFADTQPVETVSDYTEICESIVNKGPVTAHTVATPSTGASLPTGTTDLAPAYLPGVEDEDGDVYNPVAREPILIDPIS